MNKPAFTARLASESTATERRYNIYADTTRERPVYSANLSNVYFAMTPELLEDARKTAHATDEGFHVVAEWVRSLLSDSDVIGALDKATAYQCGEGKDGNPSPARKATTAAEDENAAERLQIAISAERKRLAAERARRAAEALTPEELVAALTPEQVAAMFAAMNK